MSLRLGQIPGFEHTLHRGGREVVLCLAFGGFPACHVLGLSYASVSHSLQVACNSLDPKDAYPFDLQPFSGLSSIPKHTSGQRPPPPEEPLSPEAFGKQDDRDLLLTIQQAPSQSFWYVDYYSVSNFILSQIVAAKEFLT